MSKMTMSHEKRKEHHSLNPPFTNGGGGKGVGGVVVWSLQNTE